MSESTHLNLPYLAAAQAQKHVTHNQALTKLDGLVHLAVVSRGASSPPATPIEGDRYLIAAAPTGEWAGQAGNLALFLDGQWQFLPPREGFALWVNDEDTALWFDGATWVAGATPNALQNMVLLGVNATADANAKLTVASPTTLFSHTGAGHQLKLNKASTNDVASLVLQNNFSGRAEIGLAGDDNLHVKMSADGTTFTDALTVTASDQIVEVHNGLKLGSLNVDPTTPSDGQIWYNQTLGKFRKRQAGSSTDLDTSGSGGGGLSDGDYGDVTVSGGATILTVDGGSSSFALSGTISPATLTVDQNNFTPTDLSTCSVIRLSSNSDVRTITGLAGGAAGRILTLWNIGGRNVILSDENFASDADKRFSTGNVDVVVQPDQLVLLQYDAVLSRWGVASSGSSVGLMRQRPLQFADFLNTTSTANPPFTGSAIASGTSAIITTSITQNHPGVVRLNSSTSANSGYRWQTDLSAVQIGGAEYYEVIFSPRNFATAVCRLGFLDTTTSADVVDGVYFETTTAGALVGKTASNSVRTTSAAIATMALNTWYRACIKVNRTATEAEFNVFDDQGNLLGTQTITGNLPVAAGRNTGVGLVATNSGTAVTALIDVDYIACGMGTNRPLAR